MATDDTFDELISTWLQETAPAEIPGRVLEEAAQRTRASRQQVRWGGLLRGMDLSRAILVLGGTAAIVVAAVVALSPRVGQPEVGQLPTTPDALCRLAISRRSPRRSRRCWATSRCDAVLQKVRALPARACRPGRWPLQKWGRFSTWWVSRGLQACPDLNGCFQR